MNYIYKIGLVIFFFYSCQKNNQSNCSNLNVNHLDYKIVTIDIKHFWEAYDLLNQSKTYNDSVRIIQTIYIDQASDEFKEFLRLRDFTAEQYIEAIKHLPKFYKTVRPLTMNVLDKKNEIDCLYTKFGNLYSDFKKPDICFAISPLMTGGTTNPKLILIGSEIACVDAKKVDISEITNFFKDVFKNSAGDIKNLIAHELVHTQQPTGDNENSSLLKQAIIEGSADFIASLVVGRITLNPTTYEYGEKYEKELVKEFFNDIKNKKGFDNTDSFYDYKGKRPADLGYYIGYKITESFYSNHTNKKQAVKDIINMDDPVAFLIKSNYLSNYKIGDIVNI